MSSKCGTPCDEEGGEKKWGTTTGFVSDLPMEVWEIVLGMLPAQQQDEVRFECKVFYWAARDSLPFWLRAESQPAAGEMDLRAALAAFRRFRRVYPERKSKRRFEIRLGAGKHVTPYKDWMGKPRTFGNGTLCGVALAEEVGGRLVVSNHWSRLLIRSPEFHATYGKHGLASVTVLEGVTTLGDEAFRGCSSLADIELPRGLESISHACFCRCQRLAKLVLPPGLASIGNRAFEECGSLSSVTLPEGLVTIGDYAFDTCPKLTSVILPSTVVTIGAKAFAACRGLRTVEFSRGLTTIGARAFSECSSLHSITLPEGLKTIGAEAFSKCSYLTCITLPEGLETIGDCAFSRCISLKSVTLPAGLGSVGYEAFPPKCKVERSTASPRRK